MLTTLSRACKDAALDRQALTIGKDRQRTGQINAIYYVLSFSTAIAAVMSKSKNYAVVNGRLQQSKAAMLQHSVSGLDLLCS